MGIKENITALRADVAHYGQNFFIYYFTKFPKCQNRFVDYKDKDPSTLTSLAKFPVQSKKVFTLVLDMIDRVDKPSQLSSEAQRVKQLPQQEGLTLPEFKDLFAVLVPFLEQELAGSCDSAGFRKAEPIVIEALRVAGLQ